MDHLIKILRIVSSVVVISRNTVLLYDDLKQGNLTATSVFVKDE